MTKGRFSYATEPPKEKEVKTKVLAQPEVIKKPEVTAKPKKKVERAEVAVPSVAAGTAADALRHPAAYALPAQRRGRRAEEGLVKRTDVPREQLNVRIRPELKRAAAGIAGLQGMTLGDVVEAALIAYLDNKKDG